MAADPKNMGIRQALTRAHINLAENLTASGNPREARQAFDRAAVEYGRLKADGRLPTWNEIFLKEALGGRARCEAALASKTASKNPKSRPSQ